MHPITQAIEQLTDICAKYGFVQYTGPEIETEWHNFDALRVEPNHPARDAQDTFWLGDEYTESVEGVGTYKMLPRTHTSGAQIRRMIEGGIDANKKPPFKIISAGKVFRNEATDATHEAEFYQLEGLCVGKDISIADLKNTITDIYKEFFGPETQVRFRESFFPFVKPGLEIDIFWKDKWLEVSGGGMVHPEVLEHGFSSHMSKEEIAGLTGFAFGMGIDRLVMLKYGIDDIRDMYSGDLRFSRWF
ncbi:MAG: phenylalanine--tRNA ligase subunit alpha [Patescibacteria group bacterium]